MNEILRFRYKSLIKSSNNELSLHLQNIIGDVQKTSDLNIEELRTKSSLTIEKLTAEIERNYQNFKSNLAEEVKRRNRDKSDQHTAYTKIEGKLDT